MTWIGPQHFVMIFWAVLVVGVLAWRGLLDAGLVAWFGGWLAALSYAMGKSVGRDESRGAGVQDAALVAELRSALSAAQTARAEAVKVADDCLAMLEERR